MKGFFSKKKIITKKSKIRKSEKEKDPSTLDPCQQCGLYKTCKSPKMKYTGHGLKSILIIGEAPGKSEDEDWKELGYDEPTQFIGKAGSLLRRKLKPYNIDIDADCWKINGVNCRPPKNRAPKKKELNCCKERIDQAIKELKPKFIWLLGGVAVEAFYMGRFSNLSITRWRNLCIPDKVSGAWVLPMFHPSYLLRNENDKNLDSTFDRDLKWAVEQLSRDYPVFEDFESQVTCLYDIDKVISFLRDIIRTKPLVVFDYETSAIKPYTEKTFKEKHKVWSISINGTAFPLDQGWWNAKEVGLICKLWSKILTDPMIFKIAQGLKFEDMWSRERFGVVPKGWVWCTMNASHIIDERAYFTGLKFQAYIRYGVEGYEKKTKKYISGFPFNSLNKMPLEDLLLYNGMDSLLTEKLYHDQKKELLEMKDGRYEANQFFIRGLKAFANTQARGICADKKYYEEQEKLLDDKIKKVEAKIVDGKEARKFKEFTGKPLVISKDISTNDLRVLLFDVLEYNSVKETETSLKSVDKDVLAEIDTPFTRRIIERRKLVKTKSYLTQFAREIVNGKLHPFFDLHTTRTYRSSSSSPNFQNIPVRDEEAKRICRSGIRPSPGYKIAGVDYASIEVRIAACYTKDPVLIAYINDPKTDMHRDEAQELFMLGSKQVTKDIRFYAKNCFVFPEFYGSWYKACAEALSENCFDLKTGDDITVEKHLRNKGMKRYEDFEDHVKNIEAKFWNKYCAYREWKETVIGEYQSKGYVEMFFGHKRSGHLSNNKILNTSIQGTAFHCLLWSYIELDNIFEKNFKTQLIGQIHDELIPDIYPPEEDEVLKITKEVMCNKIREEHDWIIVPLDVDVELTEIDGNWYEKKKIKK